MNNVIPVIIWRSSLTPDPPDYKMKSFIRFLLTNALMVLKSIKYIVVSKKTH